MELSSTNLTDHLLLEALPEAIVAFDESGMVQYFNARGKELFHVEASDVVGSNIDAFLPDLQSRFAFSKLESSNGEPRIEPLWVLGRRQDGTTFPVSWKCNSFPSNNGTLIVCVVRPMEEIGPPHEQWKQLHDELEMRMIARTEELHEVQSQLLRREKLATLGQVSGGIAHEVRNLLQTAKTSTYYLLHAPNPSAEKIREHLLRIDRQIDLIHSVVTALSDVARLPEPQIQSLDMREQVHEALQTVVISQTTELIVDLPEDLPRAMADSQQLLIVLRNVIRNADEAMPNGGRMTIQANADSTHVVLRLRDTGIGIAPEIVDRIAEPLFSTKSGGMGLGLSISKAIVERNRGQFAFTSELGRGSDFSIHLIRAV